MPLPAQSTNSSRVFSNTDQRSFAELSRDYNPVHLDDVAARLTTFGRTVVHGMHIALWMLDWLSASTPSRPAYRRISARFNRPLFVDETAQIQVKETDAGIELQCLSDGALLTQLKLADRAAVSPSSAWTPGGQSWASEPLVLDIGSMENRCGELILPYSQQAMAGPFPAAVATYGAPCIAHLLALTRIVGMEVPGLNSMFGGFAVELFGGSQNRLAFKTTRVNRNTSHVKIQLAGDVLTGSIDSFVRPTSAAPAYRDMVQDVTAGEFRGRRSLIIGGSRGLGLISAYILSAGGAQVAVTYRVGRAEAERAVKTIADADGDAMAIPMDVASPAAGLAALESRGFRPTDVYYFATPHIFERKKALFEAALFESFTKCYVTDFAAVMAGCCALSEGTVAFFYPSSEALNQPVKELLEYSAAKAAGESFCELTAQFNPRVRIMTARLPRLPTDQTATLLKVGTADPARVMLEISRNMSSLLTGHAASLES
jgi:NAD(P)-dependent dehydrogenase (short-subunit alcohol dehydrogenase family)